MAFLATDTESVDSVERVALTLTNHLGHDGARRAALSNHWLGVVQAIDRLPRSLQRQEQQDLVSYA